MPRYPLDTPTVRLRITAFTDRHISIRSRPSLVMSIIYGKPYPANYTA